MAMTYNRPGSVAGYCRKKGWDLSFKQIKAKGCMNPKKQRNGRTFCRWFLKNQEHPHWAAKLKAKESRNAGGR